MQTVFPDPASFTPERWSPDPSRPSPRSTSYFPFTLGPRVCIGKNFFFLEAKCILMALMEHNIFGLEDITKPKIGGTTKSGTLRPESTVELIIEHK